MNRHKGLEWAKVQAKLEANTEKLWSLNEMERTGGEPDVVGHDKKTGEYIFYDCSAESPKGRRSVCYDREALESRKEHKPENSAIDMAAAMGIELLTEEQYRELQKLGNFDTKTSSWVKTPSDIRKLGGALFCDRRYDTCLRVSQRCGILLCRQGVPWLAKGLESHLARERITITSARSIINLPGNHTRPGGIGSGSRCSRRCPAISHSIVLPRAGTAADWSERAQAARSTRTGSRKKSKPVARKTLHRPR